MGRKTNLQSNREDWGKRYFIDEEGWLNLRRATKNGVEEKRIANFEAQITEEAVIDDGHEVKRIYVLEGKCGGKVLPRIEVEAEKFQSMNWLHLWGRSVLIEAGFLAKDHTRLAIQLLSRGKQRIYFAHTGWRYHEGDFIFLSSTGAIGNPNVEVKLPQMLTRYRLPTSVTKKQVIEGAMASISFLNIGEPQITYPLFAFLYLAPLTTLLDPMPNFSGYLYGETGTLKTTLAVLLLSHFGDFSATALSNFDDTANALERTASLLNDVLHVLDDYHPSARQSDELDKEGKAQRIIRAYSNRTARGRLRPDSTLKERFEPRGLLLVTGEEIVRNQSTLARVMVVETKKGDIDMKRLSELQRKAHLLPFAMSSYIQFIRAKLGLIRADFREKFPILRAMNLETDNLHGKFAEQRAFLTFSFSVVMEWAKTLGVVDEAGAVAFKTANERVLDTLVKEQAKRLEREDPVLMLAEIINTLIEQKKIKVENINNEALVIGGQHGDFVGRYDAVNFYFTPTALWNAVQKFCRNEGEFFPFRRVTMISILKRRGLAETGRYFANGRQQRCWIIPRSVLEDNKTSTLAEFDNSESED